jgi:hypothetical protein
MLNFIKQLVGINGVLLGKIRAVQAFDEALALRDDHKYKDAIPLLVESAELGNERAMSILGAALLMGEGTPENGREAVRWLEKSIELGYEPSISVLGMAYATGKAGVTIDIPKATEMLTHAADRGDEQSARMLSMIEKGEGMFRHLKRNTRRR